MKVAWTQEQQKVIELRKRNILVSAAAGSGKTAVLVERIIAMLTRDESPASVDELLIVTFTEAAAAEMKERIRDAIERTLAEQPENEHLKQQATLIHSAMITTIHSFCLSVIRDHFHAIDLDPGFRVGEEGELKLLRREVLTDILEEKYQEGEQNFLDFVMGYGGNRNDKRLEDLILKIYEFSRSDPDGEGWLSACVQAYETKDTAALESSDYARLAMERTHRYLEDADRILGMALQICKEEDGPKAYEENLKQDLELVKGLKEIDTFSCMQAAISTVKWNRLAPNRSKTGSEKKTAYVRESREEVKELIADLQKQYYDQTPEELVEDLNVCRPAAMELADLVRRFTVRFEAVKQSRNLIDFSDMEQYALRILTEKTEEGFRPSAVAREYQKQFREIMIDEYQDSNLIQETILNSVSKLWEGAYNIFMVGDVKQSIYRFRLSRPELFMEKFYAYDTEESRTQRIDLHRNFRSRKEVLDSVNLLFRQLMGADLGGVAYDKQAELYAGAEFPLAENTETEILLVNCESKGTKGEDRKLEARAIAGRIRKLVACAKVTDKKTKELRKVRYSDIVILTRSIQGTADVFAEELNREGIPAHTGTREGYFAAREIGVVLDYLRVLDNPRQDIALAAVLASPIGGLEEEELARIRSACKEDFFWKAALEYRNHEGGLGEKVDRIWKQIEAFRAMVPYTPMHELLWKILDVTGYGDYAAAMPGGEQRAANLEMLVEKARSFETASYKGLFHFIRYIEQLQKYDVDYGEASVEDEQSDTVRIMTIHKSKGLEFPIVFVSGMGRRFNMQDSRGSVVLHMKLGMGLDAVRTKERTKSPSLIKKVIQKEEVLDSLGEELRVLYVALTRAREKLIITGTLPAACEKLEVMEMQKGQNEVLLPFSRRSKAVTYWDWILPAAVRLNEDAPLAIKILDPLELEVSGFAEESARHITRELLEHWDAGCLYDEEARNVIEEQFPYQYPYDKEKNRSMKFTVSELKRRIHQMEQMEETGWEQGELLYDEPEVVPLIPRFLRQEEELTGASRGTAYHRVMELLDFTRLYDEDDLEKELQNFQKSGRMDVEMTSCIRKEEICSFLRSPAGERMRRAAAEGKLFREQPFVLGMDARELYPEEETGEMVLVQGIIDAYYEEDEELVVLDYKTDRIYSEDELAAKYHGQLDYYAKALKQITGKKVKDKILYSFTMQKEIHLK